MKRSFGDSMKRMFGKRFKMGGYSVFASILLIVIVVIVNMICASLPSSLTQIDFTAQALYSLSDQTKRIADAVDTDVNMYLIATTGGEDETITRLLDRYDDLSSKIHVSYVDPVVDPTFLERYDLALNTLYPNSVLVDSGDRHRMVGYNDIYVVTYTYNQNYGEYLSSKEFAGEEALTNALHYVTAAQLPKVYTLEGHGEKALNERLNTMMTQDNLEKGSFSLLTEENIPEDANAIIIYNPTSDLSAAEAEKMIAYLDNGGSILLMSEVIDEIAMPNLLSVVRHMGMDIKPGLIVEQDGYHHLNQYPYYLLPDLETHTITKPVIQSRYYILLPLAQPIVELENTTADVTMLLTTSDSAYLKADGLNTTVLTLQEGDEVDSFNVGAISELNGGKLCWFSASQLLNNTIDELVSGANSDLVLNALSYLCDQEETISIRAKSLDVLSLSVPASDSNLWSILMIGVIPAITLAVGIVVYVRRKRR